MTVVRLENISKTFRNTKTGDAIHALDGASLSVREAQTTAIVGPSGSGKSTLLKVISGDVKGYDGDLFFDNRKMNAVKAKDRYLSKIFQSEARYPHFQGIRTINYWLRRREPEDKETRERIAQVAKTMSLSETELLKRKQGRINNADELRLAIGRALARNPEIFLFDEPLSNLDPQLRNQTRLEIKRLLRNFRITALFVTHDQTEAMALGNQVAVMNAGRIEQTGTYRTVYERPANTWVAGFLGLPPMNLFPGGSVADGTVRLGDVNIPVPDEIRHKVQAGQKITIGVRPEESTLVTADEPDTEGVQVQGTVDLVEPDFARNAQLIHVRTESMTFQIRSTLAEKIKVSDNITVLLPLKHLNYFDGHNEERISS
ncbi:MAG: ABC transporter ATP-binding protein [Chloroflexota bacterium]